MTPRPADERPPFHAVLSPHRSLPPAGFLVLMAVIALVSFALGVAFVMMGAWPVFGFFGLDVALIYWAFRLNYRAARLRETFELVEGTLRIVRSHPSGRRESWSFEPYWARVELDGNVETGNELAIVSHGRRLVIGRFLGPSERAAFAQSLTRALAPYKGG